MKLKRPGQSTGHGTSVKHRPDLSIAIYRTRARKFLKTMARLRKKTEGHDPECECHPCRTIKANQHMEGDANV